MLEQWNAAALQHKNTEELTAIFARATGWLIYATELEIKARLTQVAVKKAAICPAYSYNYG